MLRVTTFSTRFVLVALMLTGMATATAQAQTTWYVDDDAPNDPQHGDPSVSDPLEDGSPEYPFDAIQEGIDAAVDGDTVLVLDGTYTGIGNRDLDFGGRLIHVRSQNGPDTCVIDCQRAGRGFHFHSGETADAVVEGFTITNGTADDGGGMYNEGSDPSVTGCTFSGNSAGHAGGGMHNSQSSPTVVDCTFDGNSSAHYGGGMYSWAGSPTVTGCTFTGNATYDFGGGMYNQGGGPTVTGCTRASAH